MLIGLDYDGTYTRDPASWEMFISIMKLAGHKVICVTGRDGIKDKVDLTSIDIIYVGDQYKAYRCEQLGYHVDVWIDDMPGQIEPSRKLTF